MQALHRNKLAPNLLAQQMRRAQPMSPRVQLKTQPRGKNKQEPKRLVRLKSQLGQPKRLGQPKSQPALLGQNRRVLRTTQAQQGQSHRRRIHPVA